MQVIISWSGERSKAIGSALRDWLPLVIQSVRPWFSPEDIDKGARWLADLNGQLEKQSVALICVTPESANSPWLLFEVGALSKALEASWVCPVLFGMEPTDIQGPLAQFQATRTTKDDIRRLLTTVNKRVESALSDAQLDTLHDLLWPQLEAKLKVVASLSTAQPAPHRQVPELINELLTRVRAIERQLTENRGRDDWLRRRGFLGKTYTLQKFTEFPERIALIRRRAADTEGQIAMVEAKLAECSEENTEAKTELEEQRNHFREHLRMHRRELDVLRAKHEEFAGLPEGTPILFK